MPIKLTEQVAPKTIKMNFVAIEAPNFSLYSTSLLGDKEWVFVTEQRIPNENNG
ncbi:hypothetical protein M3215_18885 [Bacillus cytotoxicus]|uniref:Uncharacterized protein n=1 Tax=Bacillus cytotoxicus TaxID=580165 RepID=A0ACC6AB39_9BACI|nr:hypothetical protein [Bacillus cytotoxicus]